MSLYELRSRNQILEQPTSKSRSAADLFARILTEIFAPWVIVAFLPTLLAWHVTHSFIPTIKWAFLVSSTSSVIPMIFVLWGIKKGRWSDHHVLKRTDRLYLLSILIFSSVGGLTLLLVLKAPRLVIDLHASMLLSAIITAAIMYFVRLKVSIHSAVNGSAFALLIILTTNPWLWCFFFVVLAVAWSRVRLGHHTIGQVIVGVFMGLFVGGGIFILLM